MKSAYELAMERLEAEDPNGATKITSEQKKQLAEKPKDQKRPKGFVQGLRRFFKGPGREKS